MKKTIYLISIFLVTTSFFTSCFKEKDNWYSATAEYDGRYVVGTTCEEYSDDDIPLSERVEMWVYNTSDNIANEIWIDQFNIAGIPMKAKLNVTGNSENFKTNDDVSLYYESDLIYVLDEDGAPIDYYPPIATAIGEVINCVELYTRISIEEGGIIKKGATTPGGNASDSIFLKTILYSDAFQAESYETASDTWETPGTPEYDWKIIETSVTNADGWEEHWTVAGYRYTGYPEDIGTEPPIVEN